MKISSIISLSRYPYGPDPARYPIKGVKYVLENAALWKKVAVVACIGLFVATLCLVLLLVFALEPQAEAIGGKQWWSWVIAVILVLLEAALLAALILMVTFSRAQSEVFVMTMRMEGLWKEKEMKKPSVAKDINPCKRAMFVRIITYPINLIPFLGAAIYSAINATFIGWDYVDMYFEAIGMKGKAQRIEVFGEDKSDFRNLFNPYTYDSANQYCRFGFMCSVLEAVPFVGATFFPLTNACAAGLFACDIERSGGPKALITLAKASGEYVSPEPVNAPGR